MISKKNGTRAAIVVVVAVCGTLFGVSRARAKSANQFEVLTGFSSKEACSCAFVVEQTDDYCKALGKIGGFEVDVSIDRAASSVTSTFVGVKRTARFKAGEGCRTEPLE